MQKSSEKTLSDPVMTPDNERRHDFNKMLNCLVQIEEYYYELGMFKSEKNIAELSDDMTQMISIIGSERERAEERYGGDIQMDLLSDAESFFSEMKDHLLKGPRFLWENRDSICRGAEDARLALVKYRKLNPSLHSS